MKRLAKVLVIMLVGLAVQPTMLLGQTDFPLSSFSVFYSGGATGGLEELADSDDAYVTAVAGPVFHDCIVRPIVFDVGAILDTDVPNSLSLSIESHANTPNIGFQLYLPNFPLGNLDICGSSQPMIADLPPFFDAVTTFDLTERISELVEPGTGQVRAHVTWVRTGFVLSNPWQVNVNSIFWTAD